MVNKTLSKFVVLAAFTCMTFGVAQVATAQSFYIFFSNGDCWVMGTTSGDELEVFMSNGRLGFHSHQPITGPGVTAQDNNGNAYAVQDHDDLRLYLHQGNDKVTVFGMNGSGSNPDILAYLDGGDDEFFATNLDLRYVTIYGGDGDDEIRLQPIFDGRDRIEIQSLYIDAEHGEDIVDLESIDANKITVGGGKDSDDITIVNVEVNDKLDVNGWRGHDEISISNSFFYEASVRGWSGNDTIEMANCEVNYASVNGEDGRDEIVVDSIKMVGDRWDLPRFLIFGEEGDDVIRARRTEIGYQGSLIVNSGDGRNHVWVTFTERLASNTWPQGESTIVTVNCGSGNDKIYVQYNAVDQALIAGGSGSDAFYWKSNYNIGFSRVTGSNGFDTLYSSNIPHQVDDVSGIESILPFWW